jgi:drug/metabolite transporter (DMT)-like permease
LDKYLVERFFKHSDVAMLLLFTAFAGVLLLPFIWLFEPSVTNAGARDIALILISGILYMGAMLLYLRALQPRKLPWWRRIFRAVRCSAMCTLISCSAKR